MYIYSHTEDDGDLALALMKERDQHNMQEARTGPCNDDWEVSAPYIGILPDESDKEDGSPLHFGTRRRFEDDIDNQILSAL